MSVRLRSFTVPRGSRFVCTPLDGSGPVIATEGEQVTIVVSETWDQAARAVSAATKVEPGK